MGYSYVYPPLSKDSERLDSHSGSSSAPQSNQPSLAVSRPPPPPQPRPPRQPTRPSPPVSSFVDFGNPNPRPNLEQPSFGGLNRPNLEQPSFGGPNRPNLAQPTFGGPNRPNLEQSSFGGPNRPNLEQPSFGGPNRPPLAPQRPQRPPASAPSPDLDNFIPDFNPQEELEAFMETIGNDNFQDFGNFGGKTNVGSSSLNRNLQKLQRPGGRPSSGGRRVRRPGSGFNPGSTPRRRGDGFGPGGKPGGVDRQPMGDRSKYESIPLDTNNLVRKQLDVKQEETDERRQATVSKTGESVNYGYHPIIDFFRPYRNS